SENFESEDAFVSQSKQFSGQHSFRVMADPHNSSNHVGRFELRDSDPEVKRGVRTEVGFRAVEKEAWYAFSVYFPEYGFDRDSVPEIIAQWHQPNGGSPPNSVQVQDDEIYLRSIHSAVADGATYTKYPICKVQRGIWQRLVFHLVHSSSNDGLIEIWLNGAKIYKLTGSNIREDYDLPYFKVGIYKWPWKNGAKTLTSRRVLFFDDIVIANKGATVEVLDLQ